MVGTKENMHQKKNIPLKCNGKDMHIHTTKVTKHEKEKILVMKLAGSSIFTPSQPDEDAK